MKVLFRILLLGYPVVAGLLYFSLLWPQGRQIERLQQTLLQQDMEPRLQAISHRDRQHQQIVHLLNRFDASSYPVLHGMLPAAIARSVQSSGANIVRVRILGQSMQASYDMVELELQARGSFGALMRLVDSYEQCDPHYANIKTLLLSEGMTAEDLTLNMTLDVLVKASR